MSYCRWSSDNFNCDLYCYEDVSGGYTTHVANYRFRTWLRIFSWLTDKRVKINKHTLRCPNTSLWELPHWLAHKRIRLPDAGETYNDETLEDFYQTVKRLILLGYRVPNYVLKSIRDQQIVTDTDR